MHHAQIAQRAFDTPLMIAPAKALAFLSGLGPRIKGQEIRFDAMGATEAELIAARSHRVDRVTWAPPEPR